MVLDRNISKAKNSLSFVCYIFVCLLIHLFRKCPLSDCFERNSLGKCEREVQLKANNQHFLLNERMVSIEYIKAAEKGSSECRVWAKDCPLIWHELSFHSVRSGGLAVAVSLFSTVPGSCAMPPTLFGKELKYYSPHKDTKH